MLRLNLPNKLTMLRIILIPFFVALLQADKFTTSPGTLVIARLGALAVFIIAALTDMVDGYLARKFGLVTNFGKLMDPLADKLLTMSAFVVFVELPLQGRPLFPAWAIIVILAREFLVTGLRMLALERGRVIQADHLGKHKTISQLVGMSLILAGICTRDALCYLASPLLGMCDRLLGILIPITLAVMVALTVLSGLQYLWRNRDLLTEQ